MHVRFLKKFLADFHRHEQNNRHTLKKPCEDARFRIQREFITPTFCLVSNQVRLTFFAKDITPAEPTKSVVVMLELFCAQGLRG